MMKKLLLASLLLVAAPAFSQAYNHSDWLDGTVPTRDWSVLSTKPTGAAPADAFEPANPGDVGFTEGDWVIATGGTTDYEQGPTRERKFRTACEPSKAFHGDPILFAGIPAPAGHMHQGTGNWNWDQNSTTTTLRNNPASSCAGGPLNGTIYWEPEMEKVLPNGLKVGIKSQTDTFYYIEGVQGDPNEATWLRRNFGFIGGTNPADYNDTARRAEYAAAGFLYPGGPDTPAGFGGYECFTDAAATNRIAVSYAPARMKTQFGIATTDKARYLRGPGGEDPWGGACTGSIAAPGTILMNLIAPNCWDGHNLRAPDGRGHLAYAGTKPDSSVVGGCPTVIVNGVRQNYMRVPQLTAKREWRHAGPSDYMNWFLSSDRMNSPSTPADPTSKDPCRQIGPYFCNGSTNHFDWIYGWKTGIVDEWQRECLGISVRGVAPTNGPGECNTSQISKFRKMKYGGASPDPAMSGCATINACSNAVPGNKEQYAPIAAGTKITGPITGTLGNP